MKYKYFAGADISKATIDITVISVSGTILLYEKIKNNNSEIRSWLTRVRKEFKMGYRSTLFCMENTGPYGLSFSKCVCAQKSNIWVETALRIKKSLGIQRGKNDKIDSLRIAQYAKDHCQSAIVWKQPRPVINKLKVLWSLRTALRQIILRFQRKTKDLQLLLSKSDLILFTKYYNQSLKASREDLVIVEQKTFEIINQDERLSHLFHIITSVPGVGFVVAVEMIICTNEFLNFTSPKKFACYCGIAPFEYSSGTSVHAKTRISYIANIRMKSALHLPSMSVIRIKGEMRDYYLRKVSEGHPKLSVLNAIKNKIVHRVFACINQDRFYKKDYVVLRDEEVPANQIPVIKK